MARLKDLYKTKLKDELKNKFGLKNTNEVPKLEKIVVNMGIGEAVVDSKKINAATEDLMQITGQKPMITQSKKSIAGFKLRKGLNIGCKVTLRKNRMYEFLDRLVYIALPRVRDFKGLSRKSFDGNGNYSMGLKEQIIFPEINYDKIDKVRGMDISIITSTNRDDHALELLKGFNLPFKQQVKPQVAEKPQSVQQQAQPQVVEKPQSVQQQAQSHKVEKSEPIKEN